MGAIKTVSRFFLTLSRKNRLLVFTIGTSLCFPRFPFATPDSRLEEKNKEMNKQYSLPFLRYMTLIWKHSIKLAYTSLTCEEINKVR